jgi:hypothetical protein
MTDYFDPEARSRALAEFTNAKNEPHQPTQGGGGQALVRQTQGLAERVIGAQPVAVYRDEAKVLQKLKTLAAAAGPDWFYRFPVKKKEGGQDWIEGPSIKLANDVARIYGNVVVEIRELDVGDAWVFYGRLSDIESGFSLERAFRQRKSQAAMRTRDYDRQLDIAYQIGQSKCLRNVICNGLQTFCDFAFEEARNSLVDKIGSDLNGWRNKTLEGLKRIPVDVIRVERVVGRPARDWLAPDIARIVAMGRSIQDGMTTVDECFPPIEQEEETDTKPQSKSEPFSLSEPQEKRAPKTVSETEPETAREPHRESEPQKMSEPKAKSEPTPEDDPLVIAYRRGQEAKAMGHQRRALPPEYREPSTLKQAICWQAGFDSAPMPSFGEKSTQEQE